MDTIGLRPWVRLPGAGDRIVIGRPNPEADWVSLLWTYAKTRHIAPLLREMTALRTADTEAEPWLAWAGSPWLPRAYESAEIRAWSDPHAAGLAWGQRWLASRPPFRSEYAWRERSSRRAWPLALLWEMARAQIWEELAEAPQPGHARELVAIASVFYGPKLGVTVWNSLQLANCDVERELRWRIAMTHPQARIVPRSNATVSLLQGALEVLRVTRPHLAPHWPVLFEWGDCQRWLRTIWSSSLAPEIVIKITRESISAARCAVRRGPDRVALLLRWRPYRSLLPERWCLSCTPMGEKRVLLVAVLRQLESKEPSELLMQMAAEFNVVPLLEAQARWQGQAEETSETRELARSLEVETDKLRRLVHLRALSNQGRGWPKPVRNWLSRRSNRARELAYLQRHGGPAERVRSLETEGSAEMQLRNLLRVQQALDKSLQEAAARAWQELLRAFALQCFCELCGLQLEALQAADVEVAWLLANSSVNVELIPELFSNVPLRERDVNRRWLLEKAPANLLVEAWTRPLRRAVAFQGSTYWLESADIRQCLRMGSDFNTCLALRDGENNHSLPINALDINKKVIYLRDDRGRPLLRRLTAVNQQGHLVLYPVYGGRNPGLRAFFVEELRRYANECGLALASEEGEVVQLHTQRDYYCDTFQLPEAAPRWLCDDEANYCKHPTALNPNSQWSEAREFHHMQSLGPKSQVATAYEETLEWLAQVGSTAWLDSQHPKFIWDQFLFQLDYAADVHPLARALLRHRQDFHCETLPVALVALPFATLLRVLSLLFATNQAWPDAGAPAQALWLMHAAWRRAPDEDALWHHLRRNKRLEPLLWWFLSWIDAPRVVWWLRQQKPKGQPYPFVLAAGAHRHLLDYFRAQLKRQPWRLCAAAALAVSPNAEDREFARTTLHEPVIQTEMQRQLLCLVRQDPCWLTPVPELPTQSWCGHDTWKLNLLARLRLEGFYPEFPAEEPRSWYQQNIEPLETAATDLDAELGVVPKWTKPQQLVRLLYRPGSREQAWKRIEELCPKDRFDVVLEGWRYAEPDDWERLTAVPSGGPLVVGIEKWNRACGMAQGSTRLREWLEREA